MVMEPRKSVSLGLDLSELLPSFNFTHVFKTHEQSTASSDRAGSVFHPTCRTRYPRRRSFMAEALEYSSPCLDEDKLP